MLLHWLDVKTKKKKRSHLYINHQHFIYFEMTNAICVFYLGSFYVPIHSQQGIASILRTQKSPDYKKIKTTIGKKENDSESLPQR